MPFEELMREAFLGEIQKSVEPSAPHEYPVVWLGLDFFLDFFDPAQWARATFDPDLPTVESVPLQHA